MVFKVGPRLSALFVFFAGAVMALSQPPTAWWFLLCPCLSYFYTQLAKQKGWRSFLTGWLFGFGYFLAGLYWIGNALLVPGNDFKWVWPLAILGLPIGLGIITGLAACAATHWANLKTWRGFCVFIICLTFSEWLRGHILTGFPWNLYGYAWAHQLPMVQSVSLFGIFGLTLLSTLWATLPGLLFILKPPLKTVAAGMMAILLSMAGLYGWGYLRLQSYPTQNNNDIIVRVVQPSIPQEDKWNQDKVALNLKRIVKDSSSDFIKGKTYAIIWPETAISDFMMQDINVGRFIRSSLMNEEEKRFLISGGLRHEIDDERKTVYFNSLLTYDHNLMPVDSYDKSHLVPFGEYIPFQNAIPMHPFVRFSGFTSGTGIKTQIVDGLPNFSGLVCYEVIFSGAVAAKTPRPEWIVNVTNDGWYGDSPGPYQHLAMTAYRAVEEGLPLIRSANTGISAVIDPNGRVLRKLNYNIEGFIDLPLPRALQNKTLYARAGDSIFFCFLVLMLGLVCVRFKVE
jgi:apolipoprotein N-acyltransferase